MPDWPLPPYAFIPGQTPHPYKHVSGHSYGAPEQVATDLVERAWAQHPGYLWGVDLYNHGYPWEAHESWEGPWRRAERDTRVRLFLQGLIQCSAAVVKAKAGQVAGVRSLSSTGLALLTRAASPQGRYLGLDIPVFVQAFGDFAAAYPHNPDSWPVIELV